MNNRELELLDAASTFASARDDYVRAVKAFTQKTGIVVCVSPRSIQLLMDSDIRKIAGAFRYSTEQDEPCFRISERINGIKFFTYSPREEEDDDEN